MEEGKVYLIAAPWFWTYVARFVRHISFQEMLVKDAIYFTRTGATFDRLARDGLVLRGDNKSIFHELPGEVIIPSQGMKIEWLAATPWVKK